MADRSSQLLLSALTRAAAEPGVPLLGNKGSPGLFPTTATGKQAAQRCWDEGYLCASDDGRTACTITDKGLAFLLERLSPRQVLEDFVRVLEAREGQVRQLVALAAQMQASLESVRASLGGVLTRLEPPLPAAAGNGDLSSLCAHFHAQPAAHPSPHDLTEAVLAALADWQREGIPKDCPLPDLYRQVALGCPQQQQQGPLTIGSFHDSLRRLQHEGRISLQPWAGPLYEIPEPSFALLIGHMIAYYASARR